MAKKAKTLGVLRIEQDRDLIAKTFDSANKTERKELILSIALAGLKLSDFKGGSSKRLGNLIKELNKMSKPELASKFLTIMMWYDQQAKAYDTLHGCSIPLLTR